MAHAYTHTRMLPCTHSSYRNDAHRILPCTHRRLHPHMTTQRHALPKRIRDRVQTGFHARHTHLRRMQAHAHTNRLTQATTHSVLPVLSCAHIHVHIHVEAFTRIPPFMGQQRQCACSCARQTCIHAHPPTTMLMHALAQHIHKSTYPHKQAYPYIHISIHPYTHIPAYPIYPHSTPHTHMHAPVDAHTRNTHNTLAYIYT